MATPGTNLLGVVVCLAHLSQQKSPTPEDVRLLVKLVMS